MTQNITEDSTEYCEGNVCPSDEILDVKKSIISNSENNQFAIAASSKSPDLSIEDEEGEECNDEEKECFAVDNLSFCDSCDKRSVGDTDECSSIIFNNNEGAFSQLYDELVVSVFKWLPKKMLVRCMLVCKRYII